MAYFYPDAYSPLYVRPLVNMAGCAARHRLPGEIYAYLNYGGATGTAKDALAEGMLAIAMEKGKLRPGQPLVEASGGTFAVALAVAAARRAHPLYLVVPGTIGAERKRYLTFLGAHVTDLPAMTGRHVLVQRAERLAEEVGGYFVNYFSNDDNPEFHRRVTGPAIREAAGGRLDALVVGVGSGGTLTGTSEYLKAWVGGVHTVAVQPLESPNLTGGYAPQHSITGLGAGFVPENYNPYVVDDIVSVAAGDAKTTMKDALMLDGVPASIAAGAVLHAAMQVCRGGYSRVVCILNGCALYE